MDGCVCTGTRGGVSEVMRLNAVCVYIYSGRAIEGRNKCVDDG